MKNKVLVRRILDLILSKKALELSCFDVSKKSDLCDYQIVCSGQSERQTEAIANEIISVLKKEDKISPQAVEGMQSSHWILLDFGFCFIHIFTEEQRNYYALDSLWQEFKMEVEDLDK